MLMIIFFFRVLNIDGICSAVCDNYPPTTVVSIANLTGRVDLFSYS